MLSAVLILSDGNTTELLFIFRIIYFKFSFIFGELFRLWLIVVVPVSSLLVQYRCVLENEALLRGGSWPSFWPTH